MATLPTCTHGHVAAGCDAAACPHNPLGWVLNTGTTTTINTCRHGYVGACPACAPPSQQKGYIIPMGAESTPLRRVFHEVSGEARAGALDLSVMKARAERAVLRGDADREGVRAMGRDILLLIEALREGTQ